ncbi:MAG: glutamine synthetase family protein [Hyphomicrobiales bacterium]|nr:glutamine synthetase family protein [Hyphomicrobiales bacterium]
MRRAGFVERYGLQRAETGDALKLIEDRKLETVRVSFADQHGVLRGKTIMASSFASACQGGVSITSTLLLKDTSHQTVFPVWGADAGFGDGRLTGAGDVIMVPDASTFRYLPWSPTTGWVLCDLYHSDGTPVGFSSRQVLRDALSRLDAKGMQLVTGLEVEFHVLKADGGPHDGHLTHGFQYLTEDRYDQLEPVFELIRRNAVEACLPVRSLEAEFGPSQCEVTFEPVAGMTHADNMVLFRALVKQVLRREGLKASFMCRPLIEQSMANGWHLHQSVLDAKSGDNLMMPGDGEVLSKIGRQWVAGLLDHAAESCLFSTPTVNGYRRYQPFKLAPDRIQWALDNKGAMIRALAAPGDPASRIENRIGEPAANPHYYFASQILSGLDGIERGLEPPAPVETPYDSDAAQLPQSLGEAIEAFAACKFFRDQLGAEFVDYLTMLKRAEWQRYLAAVSQWEQDEYFDLF